MTGTATGPSRTEAAVDLELTAAYEYDLPEDLIATTPSRDRSESRLMVLRPGHALEHVAFADLPSYLRDGDLLVRNTARVLPARLEGRKPTGGRVELLALTPVGKGWTEPGPTVFTALGRASKPLRPGTRIEIGRDGALRVRARRDDGSLEVETETALPLRDWLERHGSMPLPPYIRRARTRRAESVPAQLDRSRYQTVYADTPGAVAAPTAGLHFTDALFEALAEHGIEIVDLHLDVGAGTFRPIDVGRLADHELHAERYELSEASAERINGALASGRRIVAVGTTVFRALEDQALRAPRAVAGQHETRLFVRPGSEIRWVGALVTNFHLPRSSLLALVCAFGGYQRTRTAYAEAIERGYRFYSYGDAMLVIRSEAAP